MEYSLIGLIIGTTLITLFKILSSKESVRVIKRKGKSNPSNEKYIKQLITIIFDEPRECLCSQVINALEDPRGCVRNNPDIFKYLYSTEEALNNGKDISQIYLFYYMEQEGYGWSLDWKAGNDDVLDIVNELLSKSGVDKIQIVDSFDRLEDDGLYVLSDWLDCQSPEYKETYDFLKKLYGLLVDKGKVLCELGRGNDAYEIFILDKNECEQIDEINDKLEFNISSFEN